MSTPHPRFFLDADSKILLLVVDDVGRPEFQGAMNFIGAPNVAMTSAPKELAS